MVLDVIDGPILKRCLSPTYLCRGCRHPAQLLDQLGTAAQDLSQQLRMAALQLHLDDLRLWLALSLRLWMVLLLFVVLRM